MEQCFDNIYNSQRFSQISHESDMITWYEYVRSLSWEETCLEKYFKNIYCHKIKYTFSLIWYGLKNHILTKKKQKNDFVFLTILSHML